MFLGLSLSQKNPEDKYASDQVVYPPQYYYCSPARIYERRLIP